MTDPVERRDLAWLQVGRGVAALLVVLAHATLLAERRYGEELLWGFFSIGNIGVDFFFVLSGFIIFYIHGRDIGQAQRLKSYAAKRLTRIYPMYWLLTLAILPVYLLFPGFGKAHDPSVAYLVKSFVLWPQEALPLLSVGWTLTHEMYFYLVFGLMIVTPRWFWLPLVTLIAVLSGYKLFADYGAAWNGDKYRTGVTVFDRSELLAFLVSRHNIEFIAGCLVGWLAPRFRLPAPGWVGLAGVVAFLVPMLLLALELPVGEALLHDRSTRTLYCALVSAVIVLAAANLHEGHRGIRPPAFARLLGDASYTLYLAHYPILIAIFLVYSRVLPKDAGGLTVQLAALLAAAAATWASVVLYRRIEKPLLEGSRRLAERVLGLRPRGATPAPASLHAPGAASPGASTPKS